MRRLYLMVVAFISAIVNILPHVCRRDIFRIAARSIGVRHAVFDGSQGIYEAPIFDRVIWPLYLQWGSIDSGSSKFMKSLFPACTGTFIDVGANIGLACIPIKESSPNVDVYAVEADPDNCECLRMNAFRAGISDMEIFNRAAYRREGSIDFERSTENSGDHRIRSKPNNIQKALCDESKRILIKILAMPLDSLIPLSSLKGPIIFKCDIQGAEVDALAGATKLLGMTDVLIIEFWPYGLKRIGADLEEFLTLISIFSYGAQYNSMNESPIHLIPIEDLKKQLRLVYARETGVTHYDLALTKKRL